MALTLDKFQDFKRVASEQRPRQSRPQPSKMMGELPVGESSPLAPIPKSDTEKRLSIAAALESELTAEIYRALEGVSRVPGVIEHARWAVLRTGAGAGASVGAEWIVDEALAGDLGETVKKLVEDALGRWSKRVKWVYSPQLASFLGRAKGLEQRGMIDSAIDLVHDAIDELLRRGQFAMCDSILIETNPDDHSADILLSLLTATAPARSKLVARQDFFRRAKGTLKRRKEYERGLLDGLG